jgi:hypothetical protein
MQTAIRLNQERNIELTHIRSMLRKLFLDITKDVYKQAAEREERRSNGEEVTPLFSFPA